MLLSFATLSKPSRLLRSFIHSFTLRCYSATTLLRSPALHPHSTFTPHPQPSSQAERSLYCPLTAQYRSIPPSFRRPSAAAPSISRCYVFVRLTDTHSLGLESCKPSHLPRFTHRCALCACVVLSKPSAVAARSRVAGAAVAAPESYLRKRKTVEAREASAATGRAEARKKQAAHRRSIFKRAEQYVKEYRSQQLATVRLKREAKAAGNFYVEPEAKLVFVVRIRGINAVSPKTKKILQLFRLRQIHNGVFVKLNKATVTMLRLVEPYITYGPPSLKTVSDLVLQARLRQAQQAAHPSGRQQRHRGCSGQARHRLRGGPHPRTVHRRPALQGGRQLPLALQAVLAQRRLHAQRQALHRGRRPRQQRGRRSTSSSGSSYETVAGRGGRGLTGRGAC